MGKAIISTLLILGFIFDHIFGFKKDKPFSPVSCILHKGMSTTIYGLLLYLHREAFMNIFWYNCTPVFNTMFSIQYSTLALARSQFIFSKYDKLMRDLENKFKQKHIHLFWVLKFLLKRENKNALTGPANCKETKIWLCHFSTFIVP